MTARGFRHLEVYECRDVFDRRRTYYFVWDENLGGFALVDYAGRDNWMACSCPDAPADEIADCGHARAVVAYKSPAPTGPRVPIHPGLVDPR